MSANNVPDRQQELSPPAGSRGQPTPPQRGSLMPRRSSSSADPSSLPDVFGPSTRPDEPVTAGVEEPTNRFIAKDIDAQLRAYWKVHQNPELRALFMRTPR